VHAGRWPYEPAAVSAAHARVAPLALAGLVLVAFVVRVLLGRQFETPWILVDELLYSELAKSLVEHGDLLIRDLPYGNLSFLYPALIAPAWLLDSMDATYGVAKALNALAMCLAAVPVYLWARRLVSPAWALVAAGLVLLLPAYVYTGTLMTENAFFPTFVLALYAFALALERPTIATQAFALGAAALACTARFQGVVLFAIFVLAVALKVLFDRRSEPRRFTALVRPYLPSLGALAVLAVAYVGWKVSRGADLASGLGAYGGVGSVEYAKDEAARWIVRHFGELALALGVLPVAALVVLVGLALRPGLPGAAERAFVAVGVSAVLLLVAEVGVFASRFALRIEERNMIHVAPALILALVLWLDRGLPRPPILAAAAAFGSAALLLLIPLQQVLNPSILSDTFALIPLLRVDEALAGGVDNVRIAMIAGGLAAALAFLFLPRRIATVALPLALAGYFVVATNSVQGALEDYSRNLRALVPPEASWVDDRVGADTDVPYLFGSTIDPFREAVALWQLEFWNRSVGGVYSLGAPNPAGIPQLDAALDRGRGTIAATGRELAGARYVLAPSGLDVAGRPLAKDAERVLYEVDEPLRVESSTSGVYTDGWMGADATYDRFEGPAGTLTVTLSRKVWDGPDKPGDVRIEVGPLVTGADGMPSLGQPTDVRTWTIHSGSARTFRLPTPAGPFRAAVHIEPTFSPADYGGVDTRQLGAQVTFGFAADR
jgi:Dolichyl-phosphate-mannose-protein mannosyltransferase